MSNASMYKHKKFRPMSKSETSCQDPPDHQCSAALKVLSVPEILQMIFSHLDLRSKGRVAQVTWLWHDVIAQPRFWSDVKICLYYSKAETEPFQYRISSTECLYPACCDQPSSRSFPLLTQLVVQSQFTLTHKTINLIVQRFRNLISLELRDNKRNKVVNDVALTMIVAGLKSLRHLNLGGFCDVTDVGVATLSGWNGVTCNGNVPTLHSLCLGWKCHLTDDGLKYLSVGQPALRSLNLSNCSEITDIGLQYLTQLNYLRVLKLARCMGIGDQGMSYLTKMENLIKLDLSFTNITSDGLELLASGDSRLTSLTLFGCGYMIDDCGPPLACLTHLNKLCLSGTDIGDSVLQCLADGASPIEKLNLVNCQNLSREAVRHLVRMVNLRDLTMCVTSDGDAGLSYLADVVDLKIEHMMLFHSHRITRAGLRQLRARLPRRRTLKRRRQYVILAPRVGE